MKASPGSKKASRTKRSQTNDERYSSQALKPFNEPSSQITHPFSGQNPSENPFSTTQLKPNPFLKNALKDTSKEGEILPIQQKNESNLPLQMNWGTKTSSGTPKMAKGKLNLYVNIEITFKAAVLNSSGSTINTTALAQAATRQIENSYKGQFAEDRLYGKINYNITSKATIRAINNMSNWANDEHLIQILDPTDPLVKGLYGKGPFFGRRIYLNANYVPDMINGSDNNTIPHEAGHTGGLKHLDSGSALVTLLKEFSDKRNMMWSGTHKHMDDQLSTEVNKEQLMRIIGFQKTGVLNQEPSIAKLFSNIFL